MKKLQAVLLVIFIVAQSCKYPPYLKYYKVSKKTHTPHFTRWEKYAGSNTNPLRSSYNVTCYDWRVSVKPEQKKLSGSMKIWFRMETPQDSILLDLERHMKIDAITSTVPLKKWRRKKNALFFVFKAEVPKGTMVMLEIAYHGTPISVLKYSSVYWRKDKNNKPWVSTETEGMGPEHLMPCKILLGDEPDSCFIRVGAPKGLVAVANGKLERVEELENETFYHWSVRNPINIYNISFNVGDYVKLEKEYTGLNNEKRTIDIYALSYNKSVADTFYDQAPVLMKHFEGLYGTFPWWSDGCKFIESCLQGSAMEHQSGISMGDRYYYDYKKMSVTLAHELGHEWWGNNLSGSDYADLWLHEGFASYSEFLAAEVVYGKKDYDAFVNYFAWAPKNRRPVLKPYNVMYNSLVHGEDQDIYYKGAMLLHTLRRQLSNDELFFKTLKALQTRFSKSNVSTAQVIAAFNAETQTDFTPFFDLYLKEIEPPSLIFQVIPIDSTSASLKFKWKNTLPQNFSMKVLASVGDQDTTIYPTNEWQTLQIPAGKEVSFNRAKFGYMLAKKLDP